MTCERCEAKKAVLGGDLFGIAMTLCGECQAVWAYIESIILGERPVEEPHGD